MEIIAVLILLINALSISKMLKIKIEEAIPISVIGIIIIIYICGIFDNLKIGVYMVEIFTLLAIISIIYFIVKEKNLKDTLKRFLTPGILIYVLFFILNLVLTKGKILDDYDEFNHWGAIIKNMFIYNKYGMHENSSVTFNEYPPFTAVFQYFFLSIKNVYAEDTIMIAQNILYISFIMPLFKNISWKKGINKLWLAIPILLMPLIFYPSFFEEILVDGLMGVVFAMGLYQIYQNKSKIQDILFIIYVISLCLIKTTGIILAIVLILAKFINMLINKDNKKYFKKIGLMLLVPIILTGTWYVKLAIYNAETNWNFKQIYTENSSINSEKKEAIIENFLEAISGKKNCLTEKKVGTWLCIIIYVTYTVSLYKIITPDKKKSYIFTSSIMGISIIAYILGLLWMYLAIFNYSESGILASYERYVGTIMLAAFCFNTYVLIESIKIELRSIMIMITACLLFLPLQDIQKKYINGKEYINSTIQSIEQYNKISIYKDVLKQNDKVYYVGLPSMEEQYVIKLIKYKMMPVNVENNRMEYSENGQEFCEKLIDDGYTYIYIEKTSISFNEKYKGLFSNESIINNSLYKINNTAGRLNFERIMK